MFCLHRKTDYALIALEHFAQRPGEIVSAREVAEAHDLPLPMLMKLLKRMHRFGLLRSVRGASGGYQIAVSLETVSLYDLIYTVEGHDPTSRGGRGQTPSPVQAPIVALHDQLRRFLKNVRLSDLVLPGRRIDFPLDSLHLRSRVPAPLASSDAAQARTEETFAPA